jgi:hypothetical protein
LRLGDAPGLAIVGASGWSTDLARVLHEASVPILLIDTFPGALDPARALGLPVLQAEILSEQGQERLQGRPVDYLLAATPDEMYNGLICTHLAPDLGRQRVFQLAPSGRRVDLQRGLHRELRGRFVANPPVDYDRIEDLFDSGWRFTAGPASPENLNLIVLNPSGALRLITMEDGPSVDPDDRVIALAAPVAAAQDHPRSH